MSELIDAEMTLIESTYNGNTKDDWSINRWTKKGDRLYLSGPAKFDKHGIYADLETQTVEDTPSSSWKTDVSIDGDELTITIEKGKVTTKTYVFVVKLESDDSELATDGGTVETHECDECGDKFDSEHGLAVHEGMVHKDNEEDEQDDTETELAGEATDTPTAIADGGQEIREYRGDIEFSDGQVRRYSADGTLYAYQEGDDHVVVSRGREPATKWTDRVPATVERPVPGQKRWTIPDNWEKRAVSKRDTIAYGLFYVPDSDVWARVSIPTNDRLVDAWHRVQAVGNLNAKPAGKIGSRHEIIEFANEYEDRYDAEGVEDEAEVIREIAKNWEVVEKELDMATDWVCPDGLDHIRVGDQPISTDEDWVIEFYDMIFRPEEALERVVDLPDDIQLSIILDELADLLPDRYRFELTLDDSSIDMEYYIQGLIEAGVSPAEAVDYYMVEVKGWTQTEWADKRGVDQSTASGNVSQAESKLDE